MFFLTEMREAQASCISRPLPPPPSLRGCHLLARAALKLSGSKSCATKREGKSATFASLGTLEYHGRRHPSSSCKASFVSASCLCFFCRHRDSNRTLYWSYLNSFLKSAIVMMDDVFVQLIEFVLQGMMNDLARAMRRWTEKKSSSCKAIS